MNPTQNDFIFYPNRYYLVIFFIHVPACQNIPHGGDITGWIWRPLHTSNEWSVEYRHRYYAEESNNPFDGQDAKSWRTAKYIGKENDALNFGQRVFQTFLGATELYTLGKSEQSDFITIQGDSAKALSIFTTRKPSWMHSKEIPS